MKSFWKPLSWDNCSSLRNLHNILFEVSYTWKRRKKLWGYAAFFLQTTNRHAKYVVENAVLRFTIQQQINSKPDTKKQLLMISHQSKLLEKHGNSFYLNEFVKKIQYCFKWRTNGSQRGGEEIWLGKDSRKCAQEHCNCRIPNWGVNMLTLFVTFIIDIIHVKKI